MPIERHVWECEICHAEYTNEQDCLTCEGQPLPTLEFDLGDTIEFQSEFVKPGGSGGTYVKNEKHVVVGLLVVNNNQTKQHGIGYITTDTNSVVPIERCVFYFPAEYTADDKAIYFSPVDQRFQRGFAEAHSIHVTNPELYLQLRSS